MSGVEYVINIDVVLSDEALRKLVRLGYLWRMCQQPNSADIEVKYLKETVLMDLAFSVLESICDAEKSRAAV